MSVDARAALDEPWRERWITHVQHAETAGPPMAPLVDVGAVRQQQLDHGAVLPVHGRREDRGAERVAGHRVVQPSDESGVPFEDTSCGVHVIGFHDAGEELERIGRGRGSLDVFLEPCPRSKPVLACEHELRVVQCEIGGVDARAGREARVVFAKTRERGGITCTQRVE